MLGELELIDKALAIMGPFSGWLPLFLPATTAFVAGARLGPMRAIMLAARSRFGSVRGLGDMPGSQRVGDVTALREGLANLQTNAYIVVSGPKGVGKSCVIATAVKSMPSVVSIDVAQGTKQEVIVESGLRAITRDSMQFINPLPNAERVLKWHNFFLAPPVLVVNVSERQDNGLYAQTTGAVRVLTRMGIRVVVDASDNSLEKGTISTGRERWLEMDVMPRHVVMDILPFKELFDKLDKVGVADVVWHLVGGNPVRLEKLDSALTGSNVDVVEATDTFLGIALAETIDRHTNMRAANPEFEAITELFKTQDEVPETLLEEKRLSLPSPCKVLREVRRDDNEVVLVPADAYMAFVLRHDLQEAPPIEELKKMVAR